MVFSPNCSTINPNVLTWTRLNAPVSSDCARAQKRVLAHVCVCWFFHFWLCPPLPALLPPSEERHSVVPQHLAQGMELLGTSAQFQNLLNSGNEKFSKPRVMFSGLMMGCELLSVLSFWKGTKTLDCHERVPKCHWHCPVKTYV